MRIFWTLVLLPFSVFMVAQQETILIKGAVSYVSSLSVYVKFPSTEGINKGDTLYTQKEGLLAPCLVVKDKSSTSCVCNSLLTEKSKVGETFFARIPQKEAPRPVEEKKDTLQKIARDSVPPQKELVITPEQEEKPEKEIKQRIKGRVSAASYSNFYGDETTHRMRYAFILQGNHIGDSKFSTEAYLTFRHTIGEWEEVQENFNNALKVYSLAVRYDFDEYSNITLGRKINQRISSMGAIDGVQAEKGFGNFLVGAIAGSRPNYADYSFDPKLLQAGAYIGHFSNKHNKFNQSTLAFVEQRNGGNTDRRFVYFQHSNTLLKDLNFFSSMEMDLYENINNEVKNGLSLTNLYASLRYRLSKKISLTVSYDNRRNIIYYESYKNYIDQLIDDETRQGLRFGINYRPSKWLTWGANANWRFQKNNSNLSKNLNSYLNFSRIPWIKTYASLSVNLLQTNYLDSKMFGLRMNRDFAKGKLNAELYGRWVSYDYKYADYSIQQKIGGASLALTLPHLPALYLYYEGAFDNTNKTLHRVNTKLIQRF